MISIFLRRSLHGGITKFFQPPNHANKFVLLTLRDESMSGTASRLRCISVSPWYQISPVLCSCSHTISISTRCESRCACKKAHCMTRVSVYLSLSLPPLFTLSRSPSFPNFLEMHMILHDSRCARRAHKYVHSVEARDCVSSFTSLPEPLDFGNDHSSL